MPGTPVAAQPSAAAEGRSFGSFEFEVFGKVQKDRFSLDFGCPFTPVSAIFVALSTFANKLAVA